MTNLRKAAAVSAALALSAGASATTLEVGGDPFVDAFVGDPSDRNIDVQLNFELGSGNGVRVELFPTIDVVGEVDSYRAVLRLTNPDGSPVSGGAGVLANEFVDPEAGAVFTVDDLVAGEEYVLRLQLEGDGITSATYAVAAIPLPAAAWLFGTAILGLFWSKRRSARA